MQANDDEGDADAGDVGVKNLGLIHKCMCFFFFKWKTKTKEKTFYYYYYFLIYNYYYYDDDDDFIYLDHKNVTYFC